MRKRWTLALALAAPAVCAQDLDPERHPWRKWDEGAAVTWKIVRRQKQKQEEETLQEVLTRVEAEQIVLKQIWEKSTPRERRLTESRPQKDGEETVKIEGKEYRCVIWKFRGARENETVETRRWYAEDLDAPVKVVYRFSSGIRGEFVATSLKDPVTACGRTFDCVRLEGQWKQEEKISSRMTLWLSPKVPGGVVKRFFEYNPDFTITYTLEEIRERPK